MVAGPRQMCCYDTVSDAGTGGMCRLESGSGVSMNTGDSLSQRGARVMLESPTEFVVLARVEGGRVSRIRTFTPDCDIDAGGMPVVWLNDVTPDDSIAWLASLVASSPEAARLPRARRQDGDDRHRAAQRAGRRSRARKVRRADASRVAAQRHGVLAGQHARRSRARDCWRA